jgi:hypothetical protein
MKNTYSRKEIPCADFIMSFRQGLLDDFINHQGSLSSPANADFISRYKDCRQDVPEKELAKAFLTKKNGEWVNDADVGYGVIIKFDYSNYTVKSKNIEELREFYPTAVRLIETYGSNCCNANYSVLRPYTIFKTHFDRELIDKNILRLHIPLLIPGDEMFMQFDEKKMYWSDLFGFDGLSMHSAHNLTEHWGMIFLLDLKFDSTGIIN